MAVLFVSLTITLITMKLISVFAVQVGLAEEMVETEEEMKKELSGEFTRLKLFFSIFWEFTRLILKCQLNSQG